jgi:TonB family protein
MVIPVNLPLYSADWILWFAERDPQPGINPQIRSPLPAKKIESLAGPLPAVNGQEESRIQLSAIVLKDGRVDDVKIVRGRDAGLYQRAIEDLKSWRFHPASHNGAPVDVDIVAEIPFRLSPHVASQ